MVQVVKLILRQLWAEQAGMNYLYNFVKFLHRVAHEELGIDRG